MKRVALLSMLFLGCASDNPNIIGGSLDHDHLGVVEVKSDAGGYTYTCSGTFLGAGLILTAAHCFEAGATNVRVHFVNYDDTAKDVTLSASSHVTFQDYQAGTTLDTGNDLAAVQVDNCQIPTGVPTTPVLGSVAAGPALGSSDIGLGVTIIGFGSTSPPDDMHKQGTGYGRHVGTSTISAYDTYTTTITPKSGQEKTCYGDSGGPLLVDRGGTQYVAGVLHGGSTNCDDESVYARTDNNRNADFIGTASAAAILATLSCGGKPVTCSTGSPSGLVPLIAVLTFAVGRRRRARRARRLH